MEVICTICLWRGSVDLSATECPNCGEEFCMVAPEEIDLTDTEKDSCVDAEEDTPECPEAEDE